VYEGRTWRVVLKMRRLYRKKALSLVKELDAFPKVPESYVETTATGGTVSLIAFTAMALLAFFVYRDTWMKYEYEVDKDFSSKLRINIDITVAMKCQHVGADILDLAETMITSNGIQYEPVSRSLSILLHTNRLVIPNPDLFSSLCINVQVIFELTPQQRLWHRTLLLIQNRLREEHSLQEVLYKSVLKGAPTALPPREGTASEPLSACRIHGHVYVNKAYSSPSWPCSYSSFSYNFSHRIDHLSFGEEIPGIINPLDGTEKITTNHNQMFQYFITERVINHAAGSHGVSGIFMKYDTSSLMVTVSEQHMPLWQFLVRLCGIIGGIFSTTGMIHGFVGFCLDIVCCRFKLGPYKPRVMLM
ncbi:unnamed protein product, partial [Coregonus sp. 'balchen']